MSDAFSSAGLAADGLRKKLDELVVTYELHPELRDVIVEGAEDKVLVQHYLHERNIANVFVYCVGERIAMDAGDVDDDLTSGVRGYIVTAARYFAEALEGTGAEHCVTFIVDRDWSWIAGEEDPQEATLLLTDFASIEMYAWTESALDKLLRIGLHCPKDMKAQDVMARLEPMLVLLFLARWVVHSGGFKVKIPARFERYCDVAKGRVEIEKLIHAAGGAARSKATDLEISVLELRSTIPQEVRLSIRGHDASRLLFAALKKYLPSEIRNETGLARLWMMSVSVERLADMPTFAAMESRVAA